MVFRCSSCSSVSKRTTYWPVIAMFLLGNSHDLRSLLEHIDVTIGTRAIVGTHYMGAVFVTSSQQWKLI